MKRWQFFMPLAILGVILLVVYRGFFLEDRAVLPSPLVGKPFPEFSAPLLLQPDVVQNRSVLLGRPVLVNVWATWCPTCRAEHDMLVKIHRETGLEIVGINYKDDPDKARRWLAELGNPYSLNLMDLDGRIGVELGVYGAPESFLLDAEGRIVYKRVGDVNERIWINELQPRLADLGIGSGQGESS